MFDIVIRRQDTLPVIQKAFYMNGQPVNLTGYTIKFIVCKIDGTQIFEHPAVWVDDELNNKVQYQWTEEDNTLVTDQYAFSFFRAVFSSDVLTVPNNRPMSMMFTSNSSHEYSYSGDPSARPVDRVRFLLGDTDMNKALFTDSELGFLLTEASDAYAAASEAAWSQSAKYTDLKDKQVGPLSISYGSMANRWSELAINLAKRGSRKGSPIAIMTQANTGPTHVRLGMHDLSQSDFTDPKGDEPL